MIINEYISSGLLISWVILAFIGLTIYIKRGNKKTTTDMFIPMLICAMFSNAGVAILIQQIVNKSFELEHVLIGIGLVMMIVICFIIYIITMIHNKKEEKLGKAMNIIYNNFGDGPKTY